MNIDASKIEINTHILIVDDNQDILDDYKKLLSTDEPAENNEEIDDLESVLFDKEETENTSTPASPKSEFQLEFASQGKDALDIVQNNMSNKKRFSVAFIDMRMPPGWDGIRTVEEIWKVDPDIEVVFCTAFSDYSLEEIQGKFGIKANFLIIRKPFDAIEIIQAAHSLCDKWSFKQFLKDRFEDAKQQLMQADKMACIGQLAAGVAHEINNPIGFISSNITTLSHYFEDLLGLLEQYAQFEAGKPLNEEAVKALLAKKDDINFNFLKDDIKNIIVESEEGIERVKQIVVDLKDFSRIGSMKWEECDIHAGIESTLNLVNNEIKYKAEIVKKYGELPKIDAVPSQLNQVFLNLLVNAGHAMKGEGKITIETGMPDGEHVFVKISDTGCGIPADKLDKIFEPFFTTKEIGKGTGLGLSLSFGIIEKHHGKIEVTSVVGEGTTFLITLPTVQDEKDSDEDQAGPVQF